jgi:hypothetical protein
MSAQKDERMPHYWLAVVSREHVKRGVSAGFLQVCHGKLGPLRRMHAGDGVVYYSPTEKMGDKTPLRVLTALGFLKDTAPYQVDMGNGFCPYRRDVEWAQTTDTPITPLLPWLSLSKDKQNWGYQLRFGLLALSQEDFALMQSAMTA